MTASPLVTVRAAKASSRVALAEGATETLSFERGWNVFVDGERQPMLWVGQHADGRMYGLLGAEIVLVTGPQVPSRIAFLTWQRVNRRAHA